VKALLLNRIALILAFAGIFISGVLSLAEHFGALIPCGASHGCQIVAKHPSSHMLGVPNAHVGLVAYAILAVLAGLRLFGVGKPRVTIGIGYLLAAMGTIASLLLTYIAVTEIHATCVWCLGSTATMILLLIVHALLMQSDDEAAPSAARANAAIFGIALLLTGIGLGVEAKSFASDPNLRSGRDLKPGETTVEEMIPADAHIYGNPTAPVAIVEFADLLCPSCQFEFPKIQKFVGDSHGKAKYVYRHYPMSMLPGHDFSLAAAAISEVAADKGLFWQFVGAMYQKSHEDFKDIKALEDVAAQVGVDPEQAINRIRNDKDPAFKRTYRDIALGSKLGVIGTPCFFLIAPGLPIRTTTAQKLFDDLDRPEYKKFVNGG
jgi:protein-disulfide isomerase/uncharacterized membrane protein